MSADRINLAQTTVMLVDDQPASLELLASVVQGFGVKEQVKCASAREAVKALQRRQVDLILVDCIMPEMDGYDFVRWLRREAPNAVRYTPAILILGHAAQSRVEGGRDAGASFILAKPLTPGVLLKRIQWLGTEERAFVDSDVYIGPDRRVRCYGPPPGLDGRRDGDLTGDLGDPVGANMDQSEIDMMMKPARISL